MKLWPRGFKTEYTHLGFTSAGAGWLGIWNSDHVVLKLNIRTSASPRREQSDLTSGTLTMWFSNWVYTPRLCLGRSSLTWHLELWPCGFKIEYTYFGFASAAVAVWLVSQGDPTCIFFTHDTYQATFISDSLWYYCRKWSKFLDTRTNAQTEEEQQTDVEVEIVI